MKDLRLHFFSERVVNRWNKLPASALEATSMNSFKARLQKVRTTEIGFFMDTSSVWWAARSSMIIIMVGVTNQVNVLRLIFRLEYANAVLYGMSKSNIVKLPTSSERAGQDSHQHGGEVNTSAWFTGFRSVTTEYKGCHVSPHDTLNHMSVLSEHPIVSIHTCLTTSFLQHETSSIDIALRAFSHAAPTVWNNLLADIHFAYSLMNFHSLLRAHFLQTCS